MAGESFIEKQEENISIHIFSVSAAMVGVCLTVLGLFTISKTLSKIETFGDELISIDAVLFLISCLLSYTALKTKIKKRRYNLEKISDFFFLIALSLIVVICILLVLEFV
jgi:uncharacterized membrane protein YidH (DUF202 family)